MRGTPDNLSSAVENMNVGAPATTIRRAMPMRPRRPVNLLPIERVRKCLEELLKGPLGESLAGFWIDLLLIRLSLHFCHVVDQASQRGFRGR